jgi:hypothetical protein
MSAEKSNHPHPYNWVIQGFDSISGKWLDSEFGSDSQSEAQDFARIHHAGFTMPKTKLRVVPAIRKEAK